MFILPLLAFPILIISSMTTPRDIYYCVLRGAVLFAALTVLACELLSLFSLYSFWPLTIYWLVVIGASLFLSRKKFYAKLLSLWDMRPKQLVWQEWISILVLLLLISATFITVLIYPPTANYDANVYHMPRVFYWLKNASVHHYPTAILRQNAMGPLPGFFIAQFGALLHGNDALAAFVQWFAYIGSMFGVAAIAKCLGGSRKSQLYAAVLAATIPMAILQAVSTQTDLFTSFWVVMTIYFIVYFLKERPKDKDAFEWAILAGLASGMIVLSKLSGIATLVPFAIMFIATYLRKNTLKQFSQYAITIIICALVVCSGFFVRNAIEYKGDFLAITPIKTGTTQSGQTIQEKILNTTLNLSRNFTFNSQYVMFQIDEFVEFVANKLDVVLESEGNFNKRITSNGEAFDTNLVAKNEHNIATNPFHALLIFLLPLLVMFKRKKGNNMLACYCFASVAAYLLVCCSVLYSSSVSRYLLMISIAGMAAVPVVFEQGEIKKKLFPIIMFLAVYYNAPVSLFNMAQPLITNIKISMDLELYYSYENYSSDSRGALRISALKSPYKKWDDAIYNRIIEKIKLCKKVGVSVWGEYPIIYNLRGEQYEVKSLIIDADVEELRDFFPEALVLEIGIYAQDVLPDEIIEYNNNTYELNENCGGILLYMMKE